MSELFKIDLPYGEVLTAEVMSKMTGLPVEAFDGIDLTAFSKSGEEFVKAHKEALKAIVQPFYEELAKAPEKNKKKIGELLDLGRFIQVHGKDIQIEAEGERPDFIVRYEAYKVGVEHTQLFDQDTQHKIGKLNTVLKMTEAYLRKNHPALTGLYNPLLDTDVMVENRIVFIELEKDALKRFAETLAAYIVAIFKKESAVTPAFVKEMVHYAHDVLSISLGERFIRDEAVMEKLAARVEKKIKKLDGYKSNQPLDAYWLLVVYNIASSSSCFNISMGDLPQGDIKFDKLFLFESFDGIIIEGTLIK